MAARSSHDFTPAGSLARTPSWMGLPRDMVTPLGRAITQVVPLLQELHLPFHDFGLRGRHLGHDLVEILLHHDRGVAVGRLLCPQIGSMPENGTKHQNAEDHQSGPAPHELHLRIIVSSSYR